MNKEILLINKRGESADFSWLSTLQKIVARKFKIKKQISIALISSKEIKALNKVYRKKDIATDVLSFNLDSREILGEIVICLGQARINAKQKKNTIVSELKLLTVHGILHLLGYDHEKGKKYTIEQEEKEKEILLLLNK
ncbi:rRNA maturation RNase YbeY [Candidatus Parcubacteria bacterium]|mgnify:FL=1|jgi:probable rRNA maturation factor|nr:rRNA maturation RNase YbeY [Candidatus Parcubacteria bacterium]MBT7228261.1 rRNA maturation RNase YbeY [Candidatus Parcubacteria bacterium]